MSSSGHEHRLRHPRLKGLELRPRPARPGYRLRRLCRADYFSPIPEDGPGAHRVPERNEPSIIPAQWRWEKLGPLAGDELELQYRHTLEALAKEKGLIGTIFRKAQNNLTDPAKLKRVVSLIDNETWIGIGVEVKGAIYEGLLEKNAAEVKSCAA